MTTEPMRLVVIGLDLGADQPGSRAGDPRWVDLRPLAARDHADPHLETLAHEIRTESHLGTDGQRLRTP